MRSPTAETVTVGCAAVEDAVVARVVEVVVACPCAVCDEPVVVDLALVGGGDEPPGTATATTTPTTTIRTAPTTNLRSTTVRRFGARRCR